MKQFELQVESKVGSAVVGQVESRPSWLPLCPNLVPKPLCGLNTKATQNRCWGHPLTSCHQLSTWDREGGETESGSWGRRQNQLEQKICMEENYIEFVGWGWRHDWVLPQSRGGLGRCWWHWWAKNILASFVFLCWNCVFEKNSIF